MYVFSGQYFVPVIGLSVFTLILYCLDYYSVISLQITYYKFCNFVLIFKWYDGQREVGGCESTDKY